MMRVFYLLGAVALSYFAVYLMVEVEQTWYVQVTSVWVLLLFVAALTFLIAGD